MHLNQQLVSYETRYLHAAENLCLLVLAHSIEDSILASTGMGFGEASRNGRLVLLLSVVCRACGTTFKRRKLVARTGAAGCVTGLAIALLVGVAVGYRLENFGLGCAAGYGAVVVV